MTAAGLDRDRAVSAINGRLRPAASRLAEERRRGATRRTARSTAARHSRSRSCAAFVRTVCRFMPTPASATASDVGDQLIPWSDSA
jgi:hypothetical protein